MITLTSANCPTPEPFDTLLLPEETPEFTIYEPSLDLISFFLSELPHFSHLVIIGQGGSISSFEALYIPFVYQMFASVHVIATTDPSYVQSVQKQCPKENTLVLAVSKSGATLSVLATVVLFADYPMVCVSQEHTPLAEFAKHAKKFFFAHPAIGGRFVGVTEVALLPLALLGVDVAPVVVGAKKMHALYNETNVAWEFASMCQLLEQKNYSQIVCGMYSSALASSGHLISQLLHETIGKEGKGQSVLCLEGPELQHHALQRIFGGRQDVVFCVAGLQNFSLVPLSVPDAVSEIAIKEHRLKQLTGVSLSQILHAELEGVYTEAGNRSVPTIRLELTDASLESLGEWVAFWQMVAVYGACLRSLDPFNQPEVESSKAITFSKIFVH